LKKVEEKRKERHRHAKTYPQKKKGHSLLAGSMAGLDCGKKRRDPGVHFVHRGGRRGGKVQHRILLTSEGGKTSGKKRVRFRLKGRRAPASSIPSYRGEGVVPSIEREEKRGCATWMSSRRKKGRVKGERERNPGPLLVQVLVQMEEKNKKKKKTGLSFLGLGPTA